MKVYNEEGNEEGLMIRCNKCQAYMHMDRLTFHLPACSGKKIKTKKCENCGKSITRNHFAKHKNICKEREIEDDGAYFERVKLPMIHPINQSLLMKPAKRSDLIEEAKLLNLELTKHIEETKEETDRTEEVHQSKVRNQHLEKIIREKDMEIFNLKVDSREKEDEIEDLRKTNELQKHMLYENSTFMKESMVSTAATSADIELNPKPNMMKPKDKRAPNRNSAEDQFMEYRAYKYKELLALLFNYVSNLEYNNGQFRKKIYLDKFIEKVESRKDLKNYLSRSFIFLTVYARESGNKESIYKIWSSFIEDFRFGLDKWESLYNSGLAYQYKSRYFRESSDQEKVLMRLTRKNPVTMFLNQYCFYMVTNDVIGIRIFISRFFLKISLNREALHAVPNRRSIQNRRNNLQEQYKVFHRVSPIEGALDFKENHLENLLGPILDRVRVKLELYTKRFYCGYIPPYKSKYDWTNPSDRTDFPKFILDPEIGKHHKELGDAFLKRSQEIAVREERLWDENRVYREKDVIIGIRDARVGNRPEMLTWFGAPEGGDPVPLVQGSLSWTLESNCTLYSLFGISEYSAVVLLLLIL